MTNDGKIYIIITDERPVASNESISNNQVSKKTSTNNEIIKHWARDNLINTTKSLVNKTIMYELSNIGNFTGNYITQTHINDALTNLSSISSIGQGALAGFIATGSPIGALIGGTLSLVNSGVNSVMQIHSMQVQNNKTNYEIAQLRNRAGLNGLKDGSRGTEN